MWEFRGGAGSFDGGGAESEGDEGPVWGFVEALGVYALDNRNHDCYFNIIPQLQLNGFIDDKDDLLPINYVKKLLAKLYYIGNQSA
mmetsp:Transcript_20194/g.32894  ORF Transcript_20194/g.32894 Transcript_20194/m.32894 type:complete len:86 (-) Transcript_20194:225-482(-)